ncbi:MAG: cation:dicarboxylase symporter family transporter [Pseudomonadota bacterium]
MYATSIAVGILKNPLTLFMSMGLGLLIGIYFPTFSAEAGPYGDIYINLLLLCVLPIIVTSVTLSLMELLDLGSGKLIRRIIGLLALLAVLSVVIGVLIAWITAPGVGIDPTASPTLRDVAESASRVERGLAEPIEPKISKGIQTFLSQAIPGNIFTALSKNQIFQVVVFSIILGIALAFVSEQNRQAVIPIFRATLSIFQKIFNAIAVTLPLAVLLLMARDATLIGADTLITMAGFVWKYYLAVLLLFVLSHAVIVSRTGLGLVRAFSLLKLPIFITISTRSSTAAIPASIEALSKGFRFNSKITNILVPLGTFMGRFGYVLYFGFATVFVTQLYGVHMDAVDYIFLGILSIFAGISTSGLAGDLALVMFSVTLEPLGLPFGAMIVLFRAIDPVIQPFRTLGVVHTNCALVSLISERPPKPSPER